MELGTQIFQYLISGVTNGAIYAVIALGFTVIYNATEIINFAQGEFVMLGGMAMITLHGAGHVPLVPGFIMAVLAVTAVGVILERLMWALSGARKALIFSRSGFR